MKAHAVGCSLCCSSGAMDDGMARKRRSYRACAKSMRCAAIPEGIRNRMKLMAATAGTGSQVQEGKKSTGTHSTYGYRHDEAYLTSPGAMRRAERRQASHRFAHPLAYRARQSSLEELSVISI